MDLVSRAKVDVIRREAERVIDLLRENQPPFCDDWENWRAPADWAIPELPLDWRK